MPKELLPQPGRVGGMHPGMRGGTAWGEGAFDSNGERIYFTGVNEDGERIRYTGGPQEGMMMDGDLACASCHGPDGRGGEHVMMHMQVMNAPDIRWSTLLHELEEHNEGAGEHAEYAFEDFKAAVVNGEHPDGDPLSDDMPRWDMRDADLEDLVDYLKSLD